MTTRTQIRTPSRQGNALVIAFGVITIAGAIAMAGADSMVQRQRASTKAVYHSVAVAALEAVMARRQVRVAELAMAGDPAAFATWDDNYGVDIIGNCEVRWRIEPVRTPTVDGAESPIPFIANPSPDLSWTPPSGVLDAQGRPLDWQPNDYVYLYRVAAEARVVNEGDADDRPLARAQGVRYVSVNNQPLFRWVIFYAAKGPKGDLELSHGSNLNILGNVHSNGAIYLGSAPNTNMWGALKPAIGFTDIGPYDGAWANWANGTAYAVGARVQVGTTKYRCIGAHTADATTQPGTGGAWTSAWQLQWRAWTSATTYAISDRVEYAGRKYKCTAPHTAAAATEPGVGAAWQSTWEQVSEARVTGVNGVFRLSKQTMIGAVNGLPLFGTPPTGLSFAFGTGEAYQSSVVSSGNTVVGEPRNSSDQGAHYLLPNTAGTDILSFTYDGVVVNPNRVRDASGMQTQTSSGADDRVAVNGVPIRGVVDPVDATLPANDSRDVDRAAHAKWVTTSRAGAPVGFDQMVRNVQTGGKVTTLPRSLENRPLEAQRLSYPTATWMNGADYRAVMTDPADIPVVSHRGLWWACTANHTASASSEPGVGGSWQLYWRQLPGEPHDYARPQFLTATGTSSDQPVVIGTHANGIEIPGQYQRYALGSSQLYMARRSGASGWDVVDRTGAPASQPSMVGLTIRERPVPDVALYPAHTTRQTSLSAPGAIPYAYGKHSRPSLWPFTAADVSSELFIRQDTSNDYGSGATAGSMPVDGNGSMQNRNRAWIHHNEQASSQSYAEGGALEVRAANNPGPAFPGGWYDGGNGHQRRPHWFAENWRLTMLAQDRAKEAATGLTATYWNDVVYNTSLPSPTYTWVGAFGGVPATRREELTGGFTVSYSGSPAPGCGNYGFAVRWAGFIRPTASDTYQFRTYASYGTRLWVNGQRLIDDWRNTNTTAYSSTTGSVGVAMTAGQDHAIVAEWYYPANSGTRNFTLEWKPATAGAWVTVPGDELRPVDDSTDSRQRNAHDWASFSALEMRLDRLTGNALQKAGLMLRGGAGLPVLQDGRGAYAFLGYSPTRGVFLQARGERSALGKATGPTKFVGRAFQGATEMTSSSGEMDTEDRDNDGTFDAGEDANGNGLFDDPATVTRTGVFLPIGPDNRAAGAAYSEQGIRTYYKPSTAGADVWGTSYGSGTSDRRFTNLTVINNPPFAIPEGTVDKVYTGPLTLQAYEVAYGRRRQDIDRYWYFHIDPASVADPAAARLVRTGTPNDDGRSFRFYQVGDRATGTVDDGDADQGSTTKFPGQHWASTLDSGNNAFLTGNTWGVTVDASAWDATSSGTTGFREFWRASTYNPAPGAGDFADPNYMQGGTSAVQSVEAATNKVVFCLTSPIDTWPKVYQGSTFIRKLTAAEVKQLMEQAYGGTYTVVTSLPSYPNPANPAYPAVADPVAPTYAQGYADVGTLRAAVNTTTTTFPVQHARSFRIGEYVLINSEWVLVTGFFAPTPNTNNHTITATRAQLGSTAAAHANGDVLMTPSPTTLAAAVTSTTATTITVASAANMQVGDVIRIPNATGTNFELMRVLNIVGSTVTVERGVRTAAATHSNAARITRVVPRTFRVDRQRTFTFDRHSFVSAWGCTNPATAGAANIGWLWSNLEQYLPWSTSMPASIVPPLSGGFQPDQWYPTAGQPLPPTSGGATTWSVAAALPSSGTASASSGNSAGVVRGTPSQTVVSPRWADDVPATVPLCPPFGTAQVWLRIERVPSTDQLRFLWRNGSSGSYTALTRSDGGEVRLDIGAWFNRPSLTATNAPGTGTSFSVTPTTRFAVGDLVHISHGTSHEVALVTAKTATTLTLDRAELGTSAINISSAGAVVSSLAGSWSGPDLQLSVAVQGGPRYWTTQSSSVGSSSSGNNQTWNVTSTSGMQVGDLMTIGERGERVQIVGINSATQVVVTRGADGTSTCPGYGSGVAMSSLTNPTSNATSLAASNLRIETTLGNDYAVIDSADWEAGSGGARAMSQYLASQYQVLWGTYDITEDFFTWNEGAPGGRTATEEWIYNPREFWSQPERWQDNSRKDSDAADQGGNGNGVLHDDVQVREWLGKTTLLSLDMRNVQDYIRTRTLDEATTPVLGVVTAPVLDAAVATQPLRNTFNGLFYAVRANRYPVNPLPGLPNPWNTLLPNTSDEMARLETWNFGAFANVLQPYGAALIQAPSFRNAHFHHGVRITNASDIDWGLNGGDEFGASKTSIVTPNQLYVQGDLNTVPHTVTYQGGAPLKLTPTAIMGDVVTLLSNGWSDSLFKQPGLQIETAAPNAVVGGGTLAFNQGSSGLVLPQAQSTSYYASILTHNQPTTRDSVYLGESSAFINTMQYLEDWSGVNMNFLGSLVVFDSRRYSEAYLLESSKIYGRSPFGFYANGGVNTAEWMTRYASRGWVPIGTTTSEWGGQIGAVQGPPNRNMDFNYDLLTEAGTPPFTPFGVTASGVGAWTRVVE